MSLQGKRILIAKPGLDGHDVGAKVIAMALRDAGAEVVYTGLRKSPSHIALVAVQEDVDAVGLSILSGSHHELLRQTREKLAEHGADDIPVFLGGSIPPADATALREAGASGVYSAEMPLADVGADIAEALGP